MHIHPPYHSDIYTLDALPANQPTASKHWRRLFVNELNKLRQRVQIKYDIQHTQTHTTVLQLYGFCQWQSGWAGTRRNIHPLTPIMVINRPLYASSIYYDPWHLPCSIHAPDNLFLQSLSKFSLVYLLACYPPLHTPYISSPNHCLLFATKWHSAINLMPSAITIKVNNHLVRAKWKKQFSLNLKSMTTVSSSGAA